MKKVKPLIRKIEIDKELYIFYINSPKKIKEIKKIKNAITTKNKKVSRDKK